MHFFLNNKKKKIISVKVFFYWFQKRYRSDNSFLAPRSHSWIWHLWHILHLYTVFSLNILLVFYLLRTFSKDTLLFSSEFNKFISSTITCFELCPLQMVILLKTQLIILFLLSYSQNIDTWIINQLNKQNIPVLC